LLFESDTVSATKYCMRNVLVMYGEEKAVVYLKVQQNRQEDTS